MVSWEYPPLVVGGISAHADGLARALASLDAGTRSRALTDALKNALGDKPESHKTSRKPVKSQQIDRRCDDQPTQGNGGTV